MNEPRPDLTRNVLAVLFVCGLILGSFWILLPFLGAIIWATTIVVATWPVLESLQKRLWGRRELAVATLTLVLLGIVFVPFLAAVGTIVGSTDDVVAKGKVLLAMEVPPVAPEWLGKIPLVGDHAASTWTRYAGQGVKELAAVAAPFAGKAAQWFASQVGGIGLSLMHFLLTVVVAAVLWSNGEEAASRVRRFARRLGGENGEGAVRLAGQAIRGIALGVVVTALAQSLLAGLGLLIAGIPFAAALTALVFILCIAQVGPILVLGPAVGYLFWSGQTGWGAFLLVWTIVVGTMDNFLRPYLIRKGADLPLILVFAGVLGGLMTFGLIGIFVGPVVLAVAHTLLEAWTDQPEKAGTPA
ncbi:MAG: AI-2E family transporter YdiK [Holophagales bacterium]|nr:AI-2E family transporter YdiK [Holophagales bacterium]